MAFGCRCRGMDEHVAFLREAACRYGVTRLEPDDAVAEESGVDGVDIVELRQGIRGESVKGRDRLFVLR